MADRIIRPATFHEHLDECRQCREHPFALCPYGAKALQREALEAAAKLTTQLSVRASDDFHKEGT
jgi:hypothetical protein